MMTREEYAALVAAIHVLETECFLEWSGDPCAPWEPVEGEDAESFIEELSAVREFSFRWCYAEDASLSVAALLEFSAKRDIQLTQDGCAFTAPGWYALLG